MPLKIGYKASAEQFGPRELVEYAVSAEGHGFDSVWISDHLQPWRHDGGHAPFALTWLSAVGERTERVQLGTSVLAPTFRYNPAVMAHAFATLGVLYPGRIAFGIGSGEALNEVAVTRIAWPDFKERFARLREAVDLIRRLWTEDRVTYEGQYYQTTSVSIYDRPKVPVPIYIAAGGPLMAKYVGRKGDGFICTSGKGMELYTEKLLPAVAAGAEQDGRDHHAIDKMIEIKLSYDAEPDWALENCRFWAPLSLSADQKAGFADPIEMEKAADQLPIEEVAKRWIVASTPDDAITQIKQYVDAGFDHLVFHGPGHDQERFLGAFAEEVLPGLRSLG